MGSLMNDAADNSPWVDDLNIGEVLRETANRFPDNDAVVFCDLSLRMSWRQLNAAVNETAKALLALGFSHGDHFGVWATNIPAWVLLQFATARIGVVLVNINPAYRTNELRYALQQSEVRGLALIDASRSRSFFEILNQACPELAEATPGKLESKTFPKLEAVISLRSDQPPGAFGWNEFLALGDEITDEQLQAAALKPAADDPINIQYTSGTTGQPKGATLSHRNVLLNAYYAADRQKFTAADRLCLPVPLYHCFGCVLGTLCSVVSGCAMIFPGEHFEAEATLNALEEERCTAVYGVPTMFIAQLEHESFAARDLSALRTGIMAGSPCPIELMKRVTTEMGASEITIGYGQTEASPLITQTCTDDPIELRVGTVGRPLPGLEAKIVDVETGETLGDDQQGELCGRGHGVMLGYYNMPDKTAEAIDADGWLHTGDLGLRQPNGYYRITGRLHDMIIRGGENVYPREIEELLYTHPAVEDVQVVGIPDKRLGESVAAWVKLKQNQQATAEQLTKFCRESLASYKTPRHWEFVQEFPTTVTGKIQKFKLREMAIEKLGLQKIADDETA